MRSDFLSTVLCRGVVVVVFTLKTVLTSVQYLLFLTHQDKETNFRRHKLTQNKVPVCTEEIKKTEKALTLPKKYVTGS